MASELTVRVDRLNQRLGTLVSLSSRGLKEEAMIQAKGIIRTAIAFTPPGGPGVSGPKSRARGRVRVATDIQKVVEGVPSKGPMPDDGRIGELVSAARNRLGATRKQDPKTKVSKVALQKFIRETQDKVGILAAGFNRAAGKLGFKPAPWIWKQKTPGAITISADDRGVRIKMINRSKFADNAKGYERRIEMALSDQIGKIERQLPFLVKRAARRSGLKTKG